MQRSRKSADIRTALVNHLHRRGRRATPERLAVIDAIASCTGLFSVTDLHNAIGEMSFPISMASVYNNVNLFANDGVLRQIRTVGADTVYYEMVSEDTSPIYMVCEKCGRMRRLKAPDLERIISQYDCNTFSPRIFSLCYYGLCRNCSKKSKSAKSET